MRLLISGRLSCPKSCLTVVRMQPYSQSFHACSWSVCPWSSRPQTCSPLPGPGIFYFLHRTRPKGLGCRASAMQARRVQYRHVSQPTERPQKLKQGGAGGLQTPVSVNIHQRPLKELMVKQLNVFNELSVYPFHNLKYATQ